MGQELQVQQNESQLKRGKSTSFLPHLPAGAGAPLKSQRLQDEKLGNVSMDELPPAQDIESEFNRIVKEMSLPAEKVELLQKMPSDKKWLLLRQFSNSAMKPSSPDGLPSSSGNFKAQTEYIAFLTGPADNIAIAAELTSLEVALRTLTISWVQDFIDVGGLDAVLKLSKKFGIKPKLLIAEQDVLRQSIRCLASVMNNAYGLRAMMRRPDNIATFTLGYACDDIKLKSKILEILGGVSLVIPDGHALVHFGLEQYRRVKLEEYRFQQILNDFQLRDFEFQTSAMAFITAFVNTPEELEVRVSLRMELLNLGISDILQDLRQESDNEDLQNHLNTFELEAESDFAELHEELPAFEGLDLNDPDEVFGAIKESIADPMGYQALVRLLQQFLILCTANPERRTSYLQLMWTLANEVTMQRNAIRIRYHVLNFNVNKVIEGFASDEEFKSLKLEAESLRKQIVASGSDMNAVQSLLITKEQTLADLQKMLAESQERAAKLEIETKTIQHKLDLQNRTIDEYKHERSRAGSNASELSASAPSSKNQTLSVKKSPLAEVDTESNSPSILDDIIDSVSQEPDTTLTDFSAAPPPPPPMFAPPPPPGMGSAAPAPVKSRLKHKAGGKMKQMNWEKVPATEVTKTIWGRIDNDEYVENLLDFDDFEANFGMQAPKLKGSGEHRSDSSLNRTLKEVTLLDSKKSYSLNILLSRIKMSHQELREAVVAMAEEKLSEQLLKQLQTFIPTPEEQTVLTENLDSYEQFGKPEKFYVEILKISRYSQRLQALNFKRRFPERIQDLQPCLEFVWKAATELRNSKKLQRVLEIVLTFGNFMNGTSFRGNAYGFQISMLPKLGDIRSNKKGSLLNYLCTIIDQKFPDLRSLAAELPSIERASKVSLQASIEEFNDLKSNLQSIREELPQHKDSKDKNDQYYSVVKSFLDANAPQFDNLVTIRSKMESSIDEARLFFNEDKKTSTEEFFGYFHAFLQAVDKARKENEREEEMARKAEEAKQAEAQRTIRRAEKQKEILGSNDRGVMDALISNLKNGTFIQQQTQQRRQNKRMSRMIEKGGEPVPDVIDAEKLLDDLRRQFNE